MKCKELNTHSSSGMVEVKSLWILTSVTQVPMPLTTTVSLSKSKCC